MKTFLLALALAVGFAAPSIAAQWPSIPPGAFGQ
jgi:opacity protein-like surface antigen